MKRLAALACAVGAVAFSPVNRADVVPASLFRDHAVLQQGMPLPIWGTADEGERVTVTLAGRSATTTAHDGRWMVRLEPLTAGGPHVLTIQGNNRLEITDVLIGEVWLCSGQSNMERQLGLREGQQQIKNWKAEAAAADFPQIRHFGVAQAMALAPQGSVDGEWLVCTPETAPHFTAVGFFFGRALHETRGVPIGLIHSSWGGTPAEAWTSADGMTRMGDFAKTMALLQRFALDPAAAQAAYDEMLAAWFAAHDPGERGDAPWSSERVDTATWRLMSLPEFWEQAGLRDFDGVVWFRREFEVPAEWAGRAAELHLGPIDDADTTWINGQPVGAMDGWRKPRVYSVPTGVLKAGTNTLAVRVLDTGGGGGLWGGEETLRLVRAGASASERAIPLDGAWRFRVAADFTKVSRPPSNLAGSPGAPTVLYNAMIAPLQPYAFRGVIWYQGEANASRAREYRSLFPNLVADWREKWGQGEFPFLYVQIAPFKDMPPEIREAQLLALDHIPHSAMAVTLDVGDADDIHPIDKRPVGERLALAARALAYGETLEYSGPRFDSLRVEGERAVLSFRHLGGGLVAKGEGELKGFVVAGADNVFHPARARIVGSTVEVRSDAVAQPVAVRYAWANVPEGNLFNRAGLPASPFRTDVD